MWIVNTIWTLTGNIRLLTPFCFQDLPVVKIVIHSSWTGLLFPIAMFLYQEWYLQIYAPSIHHLLPLRLPVWGDVLDDGCVATSLLQKSVVPQLTALTLNTENMRSACMAEDLEKATRNAKQNIGGDEVMGKFGIVQGLCFREVGFEGTGTNWFLKKTLLRL